MSTFKNALVSVSNKSGLVDFLRPLIKDGLRVVSTGGTLQHLKENGIQAVDISEQTGFPEVMDGRVKSLHPRVYVPLLSRVGNVADDALLDQENLRPFDLIIVNLYPFQDARNRGLSGDELIEYIDIGGPSLLRAAAKNHSRVTVICDPIDYRWVAEKVGRLSLDDRRQLAAKVYAHTSHYDSLIARTLSSSTEAEARLSGERVTELRYGENPHQTASWYRDPAAASGLHQAEILHGKALSYNNILDLDAACGAVAEFRLAAAVAVKHSNPCGVGTGAERSVEYAVRRAIAADPVSVFGGIIAVNREIDFNAAEAMASIFLECVIAPSYTDEGLERLKKKKDIRILKWPNLADHKPAWQFRTVAGGYLVQSADRTMDWSDQWKIIGEPPPLDIKSDLLLAWKVCAHLRSNAIAIVSEGSTIGLGMGQVNRVDAVQHAIARMVKHHPSAVRPVMASDAFFPFSDSIEIAAKAGIRWIIQPGGSIRDDEVIAAGRSLGVNQIFTGTRHFRH